jgi:basic membrane protein A
MVNKKWIAWLMVTLLVMVSLAGCAPKTEEPAPATETPTTAAPKIVLILPGPINDQGWNATAYEGLKLVEKDLGVKMEYVESVQQADFESTLRDYGEKGYDLVFAHGTQFFDAAKAIGPQYPDTFYMVINSEEGVAPNVGGIGIREWEGGYVAGTLAAMNTTSKKLGAIGSFPFPVIEGTLDAFEAAAIAVDPTITVTKTYVNSWDDIQKGKETALAMAEAGADLVFCTANQVGLGSIDAAKTKGIKAIGYISPQNEVAPGTVIASITYNTPGLFKVAVQNFLDGKLTAEGKSLGWVDDVLSMQWTDQSTVEMKAKVEQIIQDLKDGKIDNPYVAGE